MSRVMTESHKVAGKVLPDGSYKCLMTFSKEDVRLPHMMSSPSSRVVLTSGQGKLEWLGGKAVDSFTVRDLPFGGEGMYFSTAPKAWERLTVAWFDQLADKLFDESAAEAKCDFGPMMLEAVVFFDITGGEVEVQDIRNVRDCGCSEEVWRVKKQFGFNHQGYLQEVVCRALVRFVPGTTAGDRDIELWEIHQLLKKVDISAWKEHLLYLGQEFSLRWARDAFVDEKGGRVELGRSLAGLYAQVKLVFNPRSTIAPFGHGGVRLIGPKVEYKTEFTVVSVCKRLVPGRIYEYALACSFGPGLVFGEVELDVASLVRNSGDGEPSDTVLVPVSRPGSVKTGDVWWLDSTIDTGESGVQIPVFKYELLDRQEMSVPRLLDLPPGRYGALCYIESATVAEDGFIETHVRFSGLTQYERGQNHWNPQRKEGAELPEWFSASDLSRPFSSGPDGITELLRVRASASPDELADPRPNYRAFSHFENAAGTQINVRSTDVIMPWESFETCATKLDEPRLESYAVEPDLESVMALFVFERTAGDEIVAGEVCLLGMPMALPKVWVHRISGYPFNSRVKLANCRAAGMDLVLPFYEEGLLEAGRGYKMAGTGTFVFDGVLSPYGAPELIE